MLFKKYTEGFVEQTFNDAGECISQKFVASSEVEWETEDGYPINSVNAEFYHPFEMVQPLERSTEPTET